MKAMAEGWQGSSFVRSVYPSHFANARRRTHGVLVGALHCTVNIATQVSGIASLLRSPSKRRSDPSLGDPALSESSDRAKSPVSTSAQDTDRVCCIDYVPNIVRVPCLGCASWAGHLVYQHLLYCLRCGQLSLSQIACI